MIILSLTLFTLPPCYLATTLPAAMDVSCSEYIPHTKLSDLQETVYTCHPLYACDANFSASTVQRVVWRKFFRFDNLTDFRNSSEEESPEYDDYTLQDTNGGSYYPPLNISDQTQRTRISIGDNGQVLNVTSSTSEPPGSEALGYYVPTIVLSDNRTVNGPYSVVFSELFQWLDCFSGFYVVVFSLSLSLSFA